LPGEGYGEGAAVKFFKAGVFESGGPQVFNALLSVYFLAKATGDDQVAAAAG
jgi:hypothetical protein